jgi:hypothetical protein
MSAEETPFVLRQYDQSKVFKQKIKPLIDQLNAICKANNVQMAAMFCYGVQYQHDGIVQLIRQSVTLKKDYSPIEMYAISHLSSGDHVKALKYTELALQMKGQPATPDTTTIQ